MKHTVAVWVGFAALGILTCGTAFAVPAAPIPHTLRQPDGSRFQARLRGDEWCNWWETSDGRVVAQDKRSGRWGPGTRPRAAADRPRVGTRAAGVGTAAAPTGERSIPVLCMSFPDRTTKYTPAAFQSALFGSSGKTMRTYFQEVSYGAFAVNAGPSGVQGWYSATNGHDYYGYQNGFARAQQLALETVKAADAGFDFSPYDTDGDGYVESVCLIHQGAGREASGNGTDIWSHSWSLTTPYMTDDGVYVYNYVMQPETAPTTWGGYMSTVGVFCHEYGHVLGLPDLYDTDSSSKGLGNWSLMAGGSWGQVARAGDTPTHLDAWSKVKLGWVTPTVVETSLQGQSIPQAENTPAIYKLFASGTSGPEYYLVENRQKTLFDAALPGAGLLIYHVDDSRYNNTTEWYPGLATTTHYKVALEQADGKWQLEAMAGSVSSGDPGDPFPGNAVKRSFDDTSTPSSKPYDQSVGQVAVRNISDSGATMTADLVPHSGAALVDALVSNGGQDAYLGDGIRSSDGTDQTKSQTVGAGATATYGLSFENEVSSPDSLTIRGTAGTPAWAVRYYDAATGGTDITADVTGAGATVLVPGGGSLEWRVEVQTLGGAAALDVIVTAASVTDATVNDTVKASTSLACIALPDLRIRVSRESQYIGDNVYGTTGVDQTRSTSATASRKAVFEVAAQNDGTASGAFTIRGPAAASGWKVVYYSALSRGTDVTSKVTGAGWTLPSLAVAGVYYFRVEVTPTSPILVGASQELLITASRSGETAVGDAVKAITTKASASRSGLAMVTSLVAQGVGRGGAQVSFTLGAPAAVDATVVNIAGRPIAAIVTSRACEGGLQTLTWNGRTLTGTLAPAGTYLVRVNARSADGTAASAVAAVAIRR